ncbi:MAG: prepilin-type N-terminal cleavage/methylation domain-containing protein [Candidatus Omnitrophica bacterium]|nr:prepilin-type N-terminal cleavage/methylation domain-containing protein [Candidatus Omnitrophota bacterium]MCA9415513.1 prepilin-type N-terminal cleavage/methylation domain-containing protein [Candidatus Omnitrophota bacterium]MCA9439931.1 prepilin-type N-terminal cleavage/methylation domain-containing protein [Candidatus Omnitrophota bacterium]MCB9767457.1 prepilin-type N-terminal cleavage/methylation domain-containing protein [Candidatus Omnitrophota bacterium]MCB9784925.1 prepilin-type N-
MNPISTPPTKRQGFTLIELLIVIAIILILIAIALPNFLEAQMRARVVRSKGEIRSLVTAMEAYQIDWKIYPSESEQDALVRNARPRDEAGLTWLTSPNAYITALPQDPFPGSQTGGAYGGAIISYEMGGVESIIQPFALSKCLETWVIFSRGPDAANLRDPEDVDSENPHFEVPRDGMVNQYSPTNGTKSEGDIFHYGGDPFFIGVAIEYADRGAARKNTAAQRGLPVDGQVYLHRLPPGIF